MPKSKATAFPSDADFRAENDLRTLIDAEKIKGDKGRLAAAKKKAKEQREALASVTNDSKKEA